MSKNRKKIITLNGKPKPSITLARLVARSPMWENQIKFQHAFFELNQKDYTVYPDDLDCLHWWGNTVASSRNKAVALALERGSDYLMFIDDDMTCNDMSGDIIKLIDMDVDIASAVATTRGAPYWPNLVKVFKFGETKTTYDAYVRKILDWPTDKPFQVDMVGSAFMLIKKKVIETLSKPIFYMPPLYTEKNIMGEDNTFCYNAKMSGFEVWIDPSIDMRHIGTWGYGIGEGSKCFMDFKSQLLSDAKVQFSEFDKFNIINNDSTYNLVPEVQEEMKKANGVKRVYV